MSNPVVPLYRAGLVLLAVTLGAFGQPSFFPSTVRIGAALSGRPVSETANLVFSGSPGPSTPYTLSIQYQGSTANWLTVTPQTGSTPAVITMTADPHNLAPGVYTARVSASAGNISLTASTFVVLTVAPTGWNTGGVAVSPSTLTFMGGAAPPQVLAVTAGPGGTTGPLHYTVAANPSSWFTISPSTSVTDSTVSIQPIASWLAPGLYSASITLTEQTTQASTVVPVTLYVANTGRGISITPLQRSLTFNFQTNTTLNPQQAVFVNTSDIAYTNFTATASTSWIKLSTQSFAPPASSVDAFAPGLFYASADPTGLSLGSYTGKITLSSAGVASVDIPVVLNVTSGAVLNANPSSVSLDSSTNQLTADLSVTASVATLFTASVSSPWLSVRPNSAMTSSGGIIITVTADVTRLPTGSFDGSVTMTGSGGSPTFVVPVHLQTNSNGTNSSSLRVTPSSLTFAGVSGTELPVQYVSLQDAGDLANPFTVAVTSTDSWLKVDPLWGTTPALAKVTVSSSAPAGSYSGSLVFTELPSGDQKTVGVTYNVTARSLTVKPTSLTFTQPAYAAPITPQQLQVTANVPTSFQIASKPKWLTVGANGTLATPASLAMSVDPTGMAPGNYSDTVVISGPGVIQIPVTLNIAAPLAPTVAPSALTFSYALGAPIPTPQTLQVADANGAVAFTATAATASGVPWLYANPSSGTTPGTIAVRVDPPQLVPGQQSGSISIVFQDAVNTTVVVPVSVVVTGSTIQIQSVLNGATWAPTSLAPGEIVTLAGSGFGPSTAIFASPSSAGALGTTLGGVSVLFDQTPAPLLSVQNNQINAIVPYALSGRTNTAIQVQSGSNYSIPITLNVAASAPGIFTSGGSGKGQAAALNADATVNSVLNPVQRGGVIVLYLTGEGQTDAPGQDGRIITSDLRTPLAPVTATVGGVPAPVLYAGSAPGMVSGLCQVNLQIPNSVSAGTQPVEIRVGETPTQRGVIIEVR